MVDVVEGFVIGDCCFANSQSVCLIFRARGFCIVSIFESLRKRLTLLNASCWNSCACAYSIEIMSTSTRSVVQCCESRALRSVFRLLRES